jgi:UDP-N-acetyl-D-mannosaminuronic acid dehydrogenase
MVDLTVRALQEAGVDPAQAKVAVLGYAYLENSDDTRHSPSAVVVQELQKLGMEVVVHDPWVAEYQGDLWKCVSGCDAAMILVAHREYYALDLTQFHKSMRKPILIDGRNVVDGDSTNIRFISCYSFGRSKPSIGNLLS